MKKRFVSWATSQNPKRLTLRTIAAVLTARLPDHQVKLEPGFCSTNRKIPGTRLIHKGKGRRGLHLRVFDRKGKLVLDHNSAETYRYNGEVLTEAPDCSEPFRYECICDRCSSEPPPGRFFACVKHCTSLEVEQKHQRIYPNHQLQLAFVARVSEACGGSTVWKFPIPAEADFTLELPADAVPLFVAVQDEQPFMWARLSPHRGVETRHFRVAGTGHQLDETVRRYIGSFLLRGGKLVFHVFEVAL